MARRKTVFIATLEGTPAASDPILSITNHINAAIKPPRFASRRTVESGR